jgi:tRNA1(Val) A37 N6-methylase TrmN6
MALSKKEFSNYIKQFNFRELFNEMGWNSNNLPKPITISVDNTEYKLQPIAEKSGYLILVHQTNLSNPVQDNIPDYNIRKKIETKVTKLFQEHLIIFFDSKKTEQIWQLVVRQSGKPTKVTETRWHINQDPELLYQRAAGIFFELDEEDKITIVDVKKRVSENFNQNNEKVTKQFYEKFKKEHGVFLQFIKGISDKANQEWYASLMLNRLMFCYFIQKKGFLDNNKNYLRDKLNACKAKKEKVKFYSFYRNFLLVLFHKGLNEATHSPEIKIEIGKVPYLNGGLFDEHELEKTHTDIDIDDEAFERLFNFFDQYEWHLDTRPTSSGKDINPDVIGYIFEKYINDRAKMGAYYTKEDITEYISKNCIIPYLFDETKRHYPKAFNADGELWTMVKQSGDRYIYDAVKKGINTNQLNYNSTIDIDEPNHPLWADLPDEIRAGFRPDLKDKIVVANDEPHLWQIRKEWNKPAPENIALPTEIYRELIDRRKRYWEIRKKIDKGEITHINDFITYNLNIRQFAQDVVENTNDPELLKHFYKALNNVTILDPTCGSGAFLFAAMNILEPLYESCLQRMENFVAEAPKGKYKFFEETLAQVKSPEHPNLQYFIYKSIILRNLYGVDIMKEAVEIAKLRLFLKLVATVEADYRKLNLGLEPLPDIDFNIRAGNTLIGFATEAELQKGLTYTLDGAIAKPLIEEKCEIVANAFKRYKEIQLTYGDDFKEFKKAKSELNKRLKELNHELNQLLHKQASGLKYDQWLKTHQPFHWFAEFYEIIEGNRGFDVVIGNPPYVEYKDVMEKYKVSNYDTFESADLYSFVIERSYRLTKASSRLGFIIPMSCFTVDGFKSTQTFIFKNSGSIHLSNYSGDAHPSKLFEGVDKRLHILLSEKTIPTKAKKQEIYVTRYIKWYAIERENLFSTKLNYELISNHDESFFSTSLPKIGLDIERSILQKLKKLKQIALYQEKNPTKHTLYYTRKVSFFLQFLNFVPVVKDENGTVREPSELKKMYFRDKGVRDLVLAGLNSSLFYWFYIINSDCRNLNKREVVQFPLCSIEGIDYSKISDNINELMKDFENNSFLRTVVYKGKGAITVQYFNFRLSKPIIDKIDTVLAKHYGFTDEELDFIINYDIKYRMGKELDDEE